MKKLLITGSNGFIGTNLINLLGSDYEIVKVDISNENPIDILNAEEINKCFEKEKPDMVIHLAANSLLRESIKNPARDATINIIGSINLLEASVKNGVKKFIYVSTGGAKYGNYETEVNEETIPKPISPYGISKHTVEHYLDFYKNTYGLEHLSLNFGNVFGEIDNVKNNRVITAMIDSFIRGITFILNGDGKQSRDYIYVQDLCRIVKIFIDNECKFKSYNISTGESKSILDIIAVLKSIEPEKPLYVNFNKYIKGELKDVRLNCDRFKTEFEFTYTTFEQAVENTLRYYEKNINNR